MKWTKLPDKPRHWTMKFATLLVAFTFGVSIGSNLYNGRPLEAFFMIMVLYCVALITYQENELHVTQVVLKQALKQIAKQRPGGNQSEGSDARSRDNG